MAGMRNADETTDYSEEAVVTHRPVWTAWHQPVPSCVNGKMPVEFVVDLANIEKSLKSVGRFNTDYGELVRSVLCRFADRLRLRVANPSDMAAAMDNIRGHGTPRVFCRAVWCVTSTPVNVHPDDAHVLTNRRRFLTALRRRHHFHVEEVPVDYRGEQLRRECSSDDNGHNGEAWYRHEKGVDVLLAIRLIKRCLSPDRPAGVVLVGGDSDYAPALYEVSRRDPPVVAMVAAFADSISEVYFSGGPFCYSWEYPPILLDECLRDMEARGPRRAAQSSDSTCAG